MHTYKLKIHNWEKYNPRVDRKQHSWFRVNNDIAESQDLWGLTFEEKWVWLCLLGFASKCGTGDLEFDAEWFAYRIRASEKAIRSCFEKLEGKCIDILNAEQTVTDATPAGNHSVTTATPSGSPTLRTLRTLRNKYMSTGKAPVCEFDFDALYKKYPRKEGKKTGLKTCRTRIRTKADYDRLSFAIDQYTKHLNRNGTEPRFIKLFSTFVNCWEDWTDPEVGTVTAGGTGQSINWDRVFGVEDGTGKISNGNAAVN